MDIAYIKKEFGARLKAFRCNRNLTQEKLSEIINLEVSNISNIENGKTNPDFTTLCRIISNANIEPNYLLGFLNKDNVQCSSIDFEIINLLIALPKETKKYFKDFLVSIKQI